MHAETLLRRAATSALLPEGSAQRLADKLRAEWVRCGVLAEAGAAVAVGGGGGGGAGAGAAAAPPELLLPPPPPSINHKQQQLESSNNNKAHSFFRGRVRARDGAATAAAMAAPTRGAFERVGRGG
jgi:hypothetical protein